MSAEQNKILCAILTAILILLLSSFISELLYHPKSKGNKVSYLNESSEVENIQEEEETKNCGISSAEAILSFI